MGRVVQRDWRDDRIAELEAELEAKDAVIAEQDRRIAALEKQVAQLLEQLGQNSRNSHKPPSTDTPEERQKRKNREKKARQAQARWPTWSSRHEPRAGATRASGSDGRSEQRLAPFGGSNRLA